LDSRNSHNSKKKDHRSRSPIDKRRLSNVSSSSYSDNGSPSYHNRSRSSSPDFPGPKYSQMVNRSLKDLVKESKKAVNSSYGSYTQDGIHLKLIRLSQYALNMSCFLFYRKTINWEIDCQVSTGGILLFKKVGVSHSNPGRPGRNKIIERWFGFKSYWSSPEPIRQRNEKSDSLVSNNLFLLNIFFCDHKYFFLVHRNFPSLKGDFIIACRLKRGDKVLEPVFKEVPTMAPLLQVYVTISMSNSFSLSYIFF